MKSNLPVKVTHLVSSRARGNQASASFVPNHRHLLLTNDTFHGILCLARPRNGNGIIERFLSVCMSYRKSKRVLPASALKSDLIRMEG